MDLCSFSYKSTLKMAKNGASLSVFNAFGGKNA
jgi:hypothetical protein